MLRRLTNNFFCEAAVPIFAGDLLRRMHSKMVAQPPDRVSGEAYTAIRIELKDRVH
jgi:hypothetical protein